MGGRGWVDGAHPCWSHAKDDGARLFLHVAVIKLVPHHLISRQQAQIVSPTRERNEGTSRGVNTRKMNSEGGGK